MNEAIEILKQKVEDIEKEINGIGVYGFQDPGIKANQAKLIKRLNVLENTIDGLAVQVRQIVEVMNQHEDLLRPVEAERFN